ncbi:MAG: hypothetical protein SHS37scaffold145_20 [Phage 71_18]|nr:MAG: hypothetical protein SHS37scaffold145_20 [Phage 71_18]
MSEQTTQAMLDVADVWHQVMELANGQRAAALAAGYPEEVAAQMGLAVYASMAQVITATMVQQIAAPTEAVTPPA